MTLLAFLAADPMRAERLAAWLFLLAVLSPAVWRLIRWRQRRLDAIWLVLTLVALNVLTYLFQVLRTASNSVSTFLALALAAVAWSYQRHDR